LRRIVAILALLAAVAVAALAQDAGDGGDDNGFILNFLQERISAPGRQIRLHDVSGALSSRARVGSITIADDRGVWLRLNGVEIDWTRRSLLLGRVNVNRFAIEEIDVLRRPEPHQPALADRLPKVEAQPFSLPELPVSVRVAALDLPRIVLGEPVLGEAATLAATGSADLARGALQAGLEVRRLDAAAGSLDLALDFSNATRALDIDLRLQEPAGGVVATLLDIEDRGQALLRRNRARLDVLALAAPKDAEAALCATVHDTRIFGGTVGTAYHDILRLAGCRDVAADRFRGWPTWTMEDLYALDPAIIVMGEGGAAALRRLPGAEHLRGRIIELPRDAFDDPGLGMLDAAELLRANLR